jgi:hypothetical protein
MAIILMGIATRIGDHHTALAGVVEAGTVEAGTVEAGMAGITIN